jgi:hypothetical protein
MLFKISENIQQISRPAFTLRLFLKRLKANILIRLLIQIKYKFSFGKPEPSRLLIRPRRRWQDNSEVNLQETRREGVDWIHFNL